jgi:hypothetical protein
VRQAPSGAAATELRFADDRAFARAATPRLLAEGVSGGATLSSDGRWLLRTTMGKAPRLVATELVRQGGDVAAIERSSEELGGSGGGSCGSRELALGGTTAVTSCGRELRFWSVAGGSLVSLAREEAHEANVDAIAVTADGRLALSADDGGTVVVWAVAPAGGPVRSVGRFQLKKSPHHLAVAVRGSAAVAIACNYGGPPRLLRFDVPVAMLGQATRQIRVSNEELGVAGARASWAVLAPDGRYVLTEVKARQAGLIRLDDGAQRPSFEIGPRISQGSFTSNGRRLVAGGRGAQVIQMDGPAPVRVASLEGGAWGPALLDDDVVTYDVADGLQIRPALSWQSATVTIAGEGVRWEPAPTERAGWAQLTAARTVTRDGVETVRVENRGDGAAYRVIGHLQVTGANGERSVRPVYFGTIRAGESVPRTLAAVPGSEVDVRLTFEAGGDPPPDPVAWYRLPRRDGGEAAADHHAQRVFEASRAVMRDLLHDETFSPTLSRLPPDEVGFTTSGMAISYQNPYVVDANGLATNRRILRSESQEQLLAEMELMLDVYLPHEMVHAARKHLGHEAASKWEEELIANAVQAAAVQKVLASMKEPSTSVSAIHRAYDRYVSAMTPHLPPGLGAAVDAYIASDGKTPPSDRRPWEVFQNDVELYVYIGARVAQNVVRRGITLESLRDRYLVPPAKQGKDVKVFNKR